MKWSCWKDNRLQHTWFPRKRGRSQCLHDPGIWKLEVVIEWARKGDWRWGLIHRFSLTAERHQTWGCRCFSISLYVLLMTFVLLFLFYLASVSTKRLKEKQEIKTCVGSEGLVCPDSWSAFSFIWTEVSEMSVFVEEDEDRPVSMRSDWSKGKLPDFSPGPRPSGPK